jgi:polyisoprenoid-binding protein YceI
MISDTKKNKSLLIVLFFLTFYISLSAQNFSLKSFVGTVQGTSNVRDWRSSINMITCKGSIISSGDKLETAKNVELKIWVESIKGTEGKSMDLKTYEAFRYKEYPYITYTFSTAQIKTNANNSLTIQPTGSLTMGGVKRETIFVAKGRKLADGNLEVNITQKLDLGDFNIVPPTAYLGTVKVDEEIVLTLKLILQYKP